MIEDTIAQKLEALKDIQRRADELEGDLRLSPCEGINCDECPARCFCYLVDNFGQFFTKTGASNE